MPKFRETIAGEAISSSWLKSSWAKLKFSHDSSTSSLLDYRQKCGFLLSFDKSSFCAPQIVLRPGDIVCFPIEKLLDWTRKTCKKKRFEKWICNGMPECSLLTFLERTLSGWGGRKSVLERKRRQLQLEKRPFKPLAIITEAGGRKKGLERVNRSH